MVSFKDSIGENGFIGAGALSGSDRMEVTVEGNDARILLIARFDNLGKGASGAAIHVSTFPSARRRPWDSPCKAR